MKRKRGQRGPRRDPRTGRFLPKPRRGEGGRFVKQPTRAPVYRDSKGHFARHPVYQLADAFRAGKIDYDEWLAMRQARTYPAEEIAGILRRAGMLRRGVSLADWEDLLDAAGSSESDYWDMYHEGD